MKLNNKGFAITAVLYGLLILFVFLVGSYLTVLTAKKNRVDKLIGEIENNSGTIDIEDIFAANDTIKIDDITYNVDSVHGLIDTSLMYRDLDGSIVVFRGDINSNGIPDDEDVSKLRYLIANSDFSSLTDAKKLLLNCDDISAVNQRDVAQLRQSIVYKRFGTIAIPSTITGSTDFILNRKFNTEIRFYGKNPNNYIDIGDNVLWRIVGVFDKKLKLIRSKSIGEYSWDTSSIDVNDGNGVNQWSSFYENKDGSGSKVEEVYFGSDLKQLLNLTYGKKSYEGVNGSLYWNSKSGSCYYGKENSVTSCDFTDSGLNDVSRSHFTDDNMIWNLGGCTGNSLSVIDFYKCERGSDVVNNPTDHVIRSDLWRGNVGLVYPSDYGYATDLFKCDKVLNNYNSSDDSYACRDNNWMWHLMTDDGKNNAWLLTPNSVGSDRVWYVSKDGNLSGTGLAYKPASIFPTIYLNFDQTIFFGTGTLNDPYYVG